MWKRLLHIDAFKIIKNTKNLLDRINTAYDMNRWNQFNCRVTMNYEFQTAYSPIKDMINNRL